MLQFETSNCIPHLNKIKEFYLGKQQDMKDLKNLLTNNLAVDQKTRSRLRILLESLMIDLNEETYAIREEVTRLL